MSQLVALAQTTVMGVPPPTGTAVTVKGPVVPGAGEMSTTAEVGLVAVASTMVGDLAAGVVTVSGGDAGVVAPLGPLPVAMTSYVVPGARPVMGPSGVEHTTVTGEPPPTGVAVTV